jgi:hypothetical protein
MGGEHWQGNFPENKGGWTGLAASLPVGFFMLLESSNHWQLAPITGSWQPE